MPTLEKYVDLLSMYPLPTDNRPFTTAKLKKLPGFFAVFNFFTKEVHATNISSAYAAQQIAEQLNKYYDDKLAWPDKEFI